MDTAAKLIQLGRYDLSCEERLNATMLIAVQDFLLSAGADDLRTMSVLSIIDLARRTNGYRPAPSLTIGPPPLPKGRKAKPPRKSAPKPMGPRGGARQHRRLSCEELNQRNLERRARKAVTLALVASYGRRERPT